MIDCRGLRLRLSILVGFVAVCIPRPLTASSVTPDPILGKLSALRVSVSSGDLAYQPISNLDDRQLETDMRRRCLEAIGRAGLSVTEAAESPIILISVGHSWHGSERRLVALQVTVRVAVRAKAQGFDGTESRNRSLNVWINDSLQLAPADQAGEVIIQALDSLLERLEQNIVGARE